MERSVRSLVRSYDYTQKYIERGLKTRRQSDRQNNDRPVPYMTVITQADAPISTTTKVKAKFGSLLKSIVI